MIATEAIEENAIQKGDFHGECNRTCCHNEKAEYYNHSTLKYYCESCARLLNSANEKDAWKMFGHALCTLSWNEGD